MESLDKNIEQQLAEAQELLRQSEARIIELEGENKKLREDLIHDALTGLKTRSFLEARAHEILSEMSSSEERRRGLYENVGFVFCDIDDFKLINDTYGHDVGDLVLKAVAEVLSNGVRESDVFCRWGGEEMVGIMLGADLANSHEKAEKLRQDVEALKFPDYPNLKVTASFGVSSFSAEGEKSSATELVKQLIDQADEALYLAKKNGKNQVRYL